MIIVALKGSSLVVLFGEPDTACKVPEIVTKLLRFIVVAMPPIVVVT